MVDKAFLKLKFKEVYHATKEVIYAKHMRDFTSQTFQPMQYSGNQLRENDIREYVKKWKISGSTRSEEGRRCRDTFVSLKKTYRKLGISFWQFLNDRLSGTDSISPLSHIIEQKVIPQ